MLEVVLCDECKVFKECIASALNKEELEILKEKKDQQKFEKGDVIYRAHDCANHIYIIMVGKIMLENQDLLANPILFYVAKEKDWIGMESAGRKRNYELSAHAQTEVVCCKIQKSVLIQLMEKNKELPRRILNKIIDDHCKLIQFSSIMITASPNAKLSYALINLASHQGVILETKEEIGKMAGLRRETVSRILKKFKEKNIISIDNRTIEILSTKKLVQIALGNLDFDELILT